MPLPIENTKIDFNNGLKPTFNHDFLDQLIAGFKKMITALEELQKQDLIAQVLCALLLKLLT
jgi:hypothetical protein